VLWREDGLPKRIRGRPFLGVASLRVSGSADHTQEHSLGRSAIRGGSIGRLQRPDSSHTGNVFTGWTGQGVSTAVHLSLVLWLEVFAEEGNDLPVCDHGGMVGVVDVLLGQDRVGGAGDRW